MTKLLSLAPLFAVAACSGGAISVDVAMPRPGGQTTSGDVTTISSGIIVESDDGTSVCERIVVKVYAGPAAPTATATPLHTGRGLGTYDPAAAAPRCVVLAANLAPRADYYVALEYPSKYVVTARPVLVMPGESPPARTVTLGPIAVTDKQTTKLTASL